MSPISGFAGLGDLVDACLAINVRRCGEGGHLLRVKLGEKKGATACEEAGHTFFSIICIAAAVIFWL